MLLSLTAHEQVSLSHSHVCMYPRMLMRVGVCMHVGGECEVRAHDVNVCARRGGWGVEGAST